MNIKGIIPASLLDWPGRVTAVIFLGGCSWRCPHCHNADIAWKPERVSDITLDRFPWNSHIEAVTITGGEPTESMQAVEWLIESSLKEVQIKVDTNGSRPDNVAALLEYDAVHVEMDIKAPLSNPDLYAKLTGERADLNEVRKSIEILKQTGPRGMFRTVAHPLLSAEDVREIWETVSRNPYRVLKFREPSQSCQ